ncbi:MAG TPA: Mur ligase domain-containing protein [Candidatus Pacearchaeota archaeon]|nr:UDP-N-acetylmuramate--L-alanine ligase [Candidatus Parcubacteria bacterium]HOC53417.1 Mur ligase domain-containing protein [Candidatus Pacearchaeota archaeon]HQM24335.1 Mur ligase domain-containing protein [Candidatus Pacearchaeota archaeon]
MKIHFIGIGGIGVSALAKFYLAKGDIVSGSDVVKSSITDDLIKRGVEVSIGEQKKENIKDFDLIIFSPAIKQENPELKEAKEKGIKTMSYPEALGQLTKEYFTIAISGTHGKSTTTAMLGLILIKAGIDPTIIVGTKVKEFDNSNFRQGKSKYLVIEACEHEASFLNYWPKIIVVTNIEEDHLDFYSNLENIQKAFNEFTSHLKENGVLIKRDDVKINFPNSIDFSLRNKEVEELKKIMKIPGDHNILNALAALKVARTLNIKDEISYSALSEYLGSWRRLEITNLEDFILIDDYAHHPTEIISTLKAAKEKYLDKKIVCVFQPHQYQRTKFLFQDFVSVFKEALNDNLIEKLLLIDVYDVSGREGTGDETEYTSERIAKEIHNKRAKRIERVALKKELEGGDVVIIMGAGDVYNLSEEIKDSCNNTLK